MALSNVIVMSGSKAHVAAFIAAGSAPTTIAASRLPTHALVQEIGAQTLRDMSGPTGGRAYAVLPRRLRGVFSPQCCSFPHEGKVRFACVQAASSLSMPVSNGASSAPSPPATPPKMLRSDSTLDHDTCLYAVQIVGELAPTPSPRSVCRQPVPTR